MKVRIKFVGLCSFLSVRKSRSKDDDAPAPAVILHQTKRGMQHTPFLAFDTTQTTSDDTFTPITGSNVCYVELDGEELTFNNVSQQRFVPAETDPLGSLVPHFAEYAKVQGTCHWNHDRAPKLGQRPKARHVSAYVPLTAGELAATSPTQTKYYFAQRPEDDASKAQRWARVVDYTFEVEGELQVRRTKLEADKDSPPLATLHFKPVLADGEIVIWIGNAELDQQSRSKPRSSTRSRLSKRADSAEHDDKGQAVLQPKEAGILDAIQLKEPPNPRPAEHFITFYETQKNASSLTFYIPYPVLCIGPRSTHTGYCGPDTQP